MVHGIPYGLKEGELIHISRAEKGIKCDCICPSCKSALVAKKGSVKKHYFAHYTKNECNYALESSLHLAVKEILEKEKRMVIPEIATGVRYGRDGLPESTLVMSPSEIQFGSVALESKLNDFVPDIILYKNGTPLIVEVYVTHKVDEYKLQKIKKSGISAIEINLSKLDRDIIYSESMLKDIVVKSTEEKRWLFNRKYN